jgi:hypothetical protein
MGGPLAHENSKPPSKVNQAKGDFFNNDDDWSSPTRRGVPKQRSDGCGHYHHLDDVSVRALA